jgi:hypothetical protein
VNGNVAVMQNFIAEIDKAIMHRTQKEITNDDGTNTKMGACYNQIVKTLVNELNGNFYKILYPYFKEVIDNAD